MPIATSWDCEAAATPMRRAWWSVSTATTPAEVADFMSAHVLGFRPVVAASRLRDPGDPDPANAIRFFRSSHDPWIVAVNMVSEGVDIPRLRVVIYLTNRLTLLSFRQIVGRVVRKDPANVDDHGRVYLPADPRLLAMAREVTETVHLLPPPMVIVTDGSGAGRGGHRRDRSPDGCPSRPSRPSANRVQSSTPTGTRPKLRSSSAPDASSSVRA